jgi:FkbM family methyltransferase
MSRSRSRSLSGKHSLIQRRAKEACRRAKQSRSSDHSSQISPICQALVIFLIVFRLILRIFQHERQEGLNTMLLLHAKALIVGSPLEDFARSLRTKFVRFNLEMAEILLEDDRMRQILSRLLSKNSNILDVGCHIGSFLSAAYRAAPLGHHTAIEASPTKARILRKRFPRVRVEQIALCDYDGAATFEDNLRRPGFSKLSDGTTKERVRTYEVKTARLDSLDLGVVDFIKFDIEGAELSALLGGKNFFSTQRPPIIFECGAASNKGLDRLALFDQLVAQMKYEIFTFVDFLYGKGPLSKDEFRKCGIYPFRAFNFLALPLAK